MVGAFHKLSIYQQEWSLVTLAATLQTRPLGDRWPAGEQVCACLRVDVVQAVLYQAGSDSLTLHIC